MATTLAQALTGISGILVTPYDGAGETPAPIYRFDRLYTLSYQRLA